MSYRVQGVQELDVCQAYFSLRQSIFGVGNGWPKTETYSLTDQVRRSSRSIGVNIMEAWGKRRCEAHFISKLADADGEQNETRHWLDTAFLCGYLMDNLYRDLDEKCRHVGTMLGKMLASSADWAVPPSDRLTV